MNESHYDINNDGKAYGEPIGRIDPDGTPYEKFPNSMTIDRVFAQAVVYDETAYNKKYRDAGAAIVKNVK